MRDRCGGKVLEQPAPSDGGYARTGGHGMGEIAEVNGGWLGPPTNTNHITSLRDRHGGTDFQPNRTIND